MGLVRCCLCLRALLPKWHRRMLRMCRLSLLIVRSCESDCFCWISENSTLWNSSKHLTWSDLAMFCWTRGRLYVKIEYARRETCSSNLACWSIDLCVTLGFFVKLTCFDCLIGFCVVLENCFLFCPIGTCWTSGTDCETFEDSSLFLRSFVEPPGNWNETAFSFSLGAL